MSRSEKRQRTRLIAVRLTPDEHATLQAAADRDGLPLSGFVRECALQRAADKPEQVGGVS